MKAKDVRPKISEMKVSYVFQEIAPMIKAARLWYAVYRMMADYRVIEVEDFDTFLYMLQKEVPHHEHVPLKVELQRLAVQSFAKPVKLWTPSNAPVRGQRYKSYVEIANKTEELLIS